METMEENRPPRHKPIEKWYKSRWVPIFFVALLCLSLYAAVNMRIQEVESLNASTNNASAYAEGVERQCSEGVVVKTAAGRNLCPDAKDVKENPTSPIPGANGIDGKDGKDGLNGSNGLNGTNGVDGKDGKDGKDGLNGINGIDGKDGLNGTNGIDGKDGLNGTNGMDGADGKDGRTPTSFTMVDSAGRTSTCTPNPPGSSHFTCTYDPVAVPTASTKP